MLQLEVRPDDPYSVFLRVVMVDDDLYLDAAPGRKWHKLLQENPVIKIKLGEKIYAATVEAVDPSTLRKRFLPGRTIYRVKPTRAP